MIPKAKRASNLGSSRSPQASRIALTCLGSTAAVAVGLKSTPDPVVQNVQR